MSLEAHKFTAHAAMMKKGADKKKEEKPKEEKPKEEKPKVRCASALLPRGRWLSRRFTSTHYLPGLTAFN